MPIASRVLGIVALATFATQVLGEDDFPIVGTYTENTPCAGGGSDVSRARMSDTKSAVSKPLSAPTVMRLALHRLSVPTDLRLAVTVFHAPAIIEPAPLDLAKHVFQVHGADAARATVLRKQLRRAQVLAFFSRLPRCLVGDGGMCDGALLGAGVERVGP